MATCGGKGYCSELTGECVCNTDAAGKNCECVATPLTTYPFADPLKNEDKPGCCGYGFEECPAESSNAGRCVLAPADKAKCPVFREDNTTLIILVVLALMFGGYLGAAVIAFCITRPRPSCTLVISIPEVLVLREILFKRSRMDTLPKEYMELEVPLKHNFLKVKRMIARRLKSQPDPEQLKLSYLVRRSCIHASPRFLHPSPSSTPSKMYVELLCMHILFAIIVVCPLPSLLNRVFIFRLTSVGHRQCYP